MSNSIDQQLEEKARQEVEERNNGNNEGSKIVTLSKFYSSPFTDEILKDYQFKWEGTRGYLWCYLDNKKLWVRNGEDTIKHYFRKLTSTLDTPDKQKRHIEEIIADVQGRTYSIDGLPEANINLIPFNNGVYDLDTDEFRGLSAEDFFTWKLPFNYNPHADCKYLVSLINSMVPENDRITLWELMAYTLWRGYPFQVFFMLLGGGRNGKSTFMNILIRMLDKRNISQVSLNDIQNNRFAASGLYHKLANVTGEIDYTDLKNTRLLKQLTGGDFVEADRKFLNPVKFMNHAKLIFLTNQLPKTHDTTEAFYRRVFIIDFPYKFDLDPSIPTKINSDTPEMIAEYEGLLYTVLQYLKILIKQNFMFTAGQDTEKIREKYNRLSNPLIQFLDMHFERTYSHDDFIYKFEFTELLNDWLREQGFNTYNDKKIGIEMKEIGYEDGKKGMKQYRAWLGIRRK